MIALSGPDLIRLAFLITVLTGAIGGYSVAYNKRYLSVIALISYELIVVFLLLRSDQSVSFVLLEQAIMFLFFYVLVSSLDQFRRPLKAAILASVFPVIMVLIKPLRIYFFCNLVFLCEF